MKEVVALTIGKLWSTSRPSRFTLYEKTKSTGIYRELLQYEEPLVLTLLATSSQAAAEDFSLVLRERQDLTDVWIDFSLPELENFLAMLENEQSEAIREARSFGFDACAFFSALFF